ncbi:hypothetical protein DGWBC_0651 [Dehalogenimonas sp. WBC-2]|nr:hypothetical protein DGWBC_0651 [Dehalogenimonas sp. WBC-2]
MIERAHKVVMNKSKPYTPSEMNKILFLSALDGSDASGVLSDTKTKKAVRIIETKRGANNNVKSNIKGKAFI